MRKIKFRGQRQSDNKWIYGDLLQPIEICDIYEISDCESIDGSRYDVVEDTIGQYTGLKDKNGKEIYEGDIVKVVFQGEVEKYYVLYDESNTCFRMFSTLNFPKDSFCDFTENEIDLYEVIGNVWEDSDLLNDSKNTKSN